MAMGTGASGNSLGGRRGRDRARARLEKARWLRARRAELEGLESRTLLSTLPALPAATTTIPPINVSGLSDVSTQGNVDSPTVRIDPTDPSKMVAVWVDDNPNAPPNGPYDNVRGAYSIDSGKDWLSFSAEVVLLDPTTSNPTIPYHSITNPSVAFDNSGNFYVLDLEHNSGYTSGAVVLERYSFATDIPAQQNFTTPYSQGFGGGSRDSILYQWIGGSDAAAYPTLAVDDNPAAPYTDPVTGTTQNDPYSGNLYIAWSSGTLPPAAVTNTTYFNSNATIFLASSDQGNSFSAQVTANSSGYGPTLERDSQPQIVISQGRPATESGKLGDLGVAPGTVTVAWTDIGSAATTNPDTNQSVLRDNTITPGRNYPANDILGLANGGLIAAGSQTAPAFNMYPQTVTIPTDQVPNVDNLTLSLGITDQNLANLGLVLIAPGGQTFTLFAPQTINGTTNQNVGVSGQNLGIENGFVEGTTFDDAAARSIVDIGPTGNRGAAAPFIGDFRVENDGATRFGTNQGTTVVTPGNGSVTTLDQFLQEVKAAGNLNGQWTLEAVDTETSAPSTPNYVNFWSLNFSTGLQVGTQVNMDPSAAVPVGAAPAQYTPQPLQGSTTQNFPTSSPASPVGIGPGLVLAADNTLGSFSPYEGRIYAAFVGYINVKVAGLQNPTSHTDVYLEYSDDAGRSWSFAGAVNGTSSQVDGYSEQNNDPSNPDQIVGRSHFLPQIAVDQTTGTVVVSYLDAGFDASNTRTATDVVTSIDGGQSWSPLAYANPNLTATDAITGKTVIIGPQTSNESSGNGQNDATYGYGDQMGLYVNDGTVLVGMASNFNRAYISNGTVTGDPSNMWLATMAIAAGPRIVDSTMGPIPLSNGEDGYQQAASGQLRFTVQFDRPINPPSLGGYTTTPSFTTKDVQVFYRGTANGVPPVPLTVLGIAPILSSGVGAVNPQTGINDDRFGYTEFTVTFSTAAVLNGDYTGTYSYLIAPDDGQGNAIVSPIASFINVPAPQAVVTQAATGLPLPVPSIGTGGTGTSDDFTTSTINITGHPDQNVTGVTVGLNLNHTHDGDLVITVRAPNGRTSTLYDNPGDSGQNFNGTTFSDAGQPIFNGTAPYTGTFLPFTALANLDGSPVDGTWTLTIDDQQANNLGTLNGWSLTINSSATNFVLQTGAPMDQNANSITDQNAVTTPYIGTTPGDVYAVPTPQPIAPKEFDGAASILNPSFDQNTLPLIVAGPQLNANAGTSVPGGASAGNLVTNGDVSSMNLSFDRPINVADFSTASNPAVANLISIMGPTGSLTGPQSFPSNNVAQAIPAATTTSNGTLLSPLTVPGSGGTFLIQDITVQINAAFSKDSALSAVLIAPDGTMIPLFSGVGGTGQGFVNTTFTTSSKATPIAQGTAPFTGTFQPSGSLASLIGKAVDGTWNLLLTNTATGASGTLASWSMSVTPKIQVNPIGATESQINGATYATGFTVLFPQQNLSGTYTIQVSPGAPGGPSVQDQFGNLLDTSQDAGVDVLRGQGQGAKTPVAPIYYTAGDLPAAIPAPTPGSGGGPATAGTMMSTINVPDNFLVQGDTTSAEVVGLQVQLNITYPHDSDLSATLYYDYGGAGQVAVPLFSGVGAGSRSANFTNTLFADSSGTPIDQGGAPFFGTFDPTMPLSAFQGLNAQGNWTLAITNSATGTLATGTLNSWSLTFQKPLPTTGTGQPNTDDIDASFRIFDLSPSDPLAGQQWTAVGPASIGGGGSANTPSSFEDSVGARSGRIGGITIDPSDPSGNTVYVAGASGGIWKTTDFLTTNPAGPTYIPLTSFGPTSGVNVGGLAVIGRNNNTNQSIVIAATGEGDTGSPGVGFLISMDGGATWALSDSTNNVDSSGNPLPISSPLRDRKFVGSDAFKVVVDPQLTPSGQAIIYAALSGNNGGIWRSEDTGKTWELMLSGPATDVALDPMSGNKIDPATNTDVQGNLQVVYAAIQGQGVSMSPNQGQVWNQMLGTTGNPLIIDATTNKNTNPASTPSPNSGGGRISLAVPSPTGTPSEDAVYEGWLYAMVSNAAGTALDGIYVTKDFGQNWTKVRIPTFPPATTAGVTNNQAIPSNNISNPDYQFIGSTQAPQGNYNQVLAVDPTNPNIIYAGGSADVGESALIRIDLTKIWDAHNLTAYSDVSNDNGALDLASTGPAAVDNNQNVPGRINPLFGLDTTHYLNYIRSPSDPFNGDATLTVVNLASFTNSGAGVVWVPLDVQGQTGYSTDYHRVATMVDPTTGLPRLIFGNDQGVFSMLDNNSAFETQVGNSDQLAGVNRNGNLQITQFYYGAAQPSSAAAQIAGALFYGSAQDDGGPTSDPGVVSNGDITGTGPGGDAGGVATNQQGTGGAYQYFWPCCGGVDTSFFQYISPTQGYIGRTNGLLQASGALPTPDPQWPLEGVLDFAVNPVNGNDVVISSGVGRIFSTTDGGVHWFDVGDPAVFGSPTGGGDAGRRLGSVAAYGAPDPSAPEGIGNLNNFLYVGTTTGKVYITQDGGGNGSGGTNADNNWLNASLGLDGSPINQIITDPVRGSHDAYAVTDTGVFYIKDSVLLAQNPANTAYAWTNITGNLQNLAYSIFGQGYDPTADTNPVSTYNQARNLTSITADWRYQIPNNPANPAAGYHPVLYVGADSGVYISTDDGQSWSLFPETSFGAVSQGGNLPHVIVSTLSLSLGNIDPNSGMPVMAGPYNPTTISKGQSATTTPDPDTLMAATYGQGDYAINLAPMLFPTSVVPASSDVANTDSSGYAVVNTAKPTINGTSEITKFGNATWVSIVDETPGDPNFGKVIGGFDPTNLTGLSPSSANSTDAFGNFAIPVTTAFGSDSTPFSGTLTAGSTTVTGLSTVQGLTVGEGVSGPGLPAGTTIASINTSTSSLTLSAAPMTGGSSVNLIAGLKTITLYTYDNAGARSNPVSLTFDLQATDIIPPPPTSPPPAPTLQIGIAGTAPVTTSQTAAPFSGTTVTGTSIAITELWTDAPGGAQTLPAGQEPVVTINSDGSYSFNFADFTSGGAPVKFGTFTVTATATYTLYPGVGSSIASVTFKIDDQPPVNVTDLRLDPVSDTGIAGDNITGDRTPEFIGTTAPGDTVELFMGGLSGVQTQVTASATTSTDANGQTYNFAIQLPFALATGQTGVYVEVINKAGIVSTPSNVVGVDIAAIPADYNGGPATDPAVFTRNTTTNQVQWTVQTPAGVAPPWFGGSNAAYTPAVTFSGVLTAGSATVAGIPSTSLPGLAPGDLVGGLGIPAGTTILAVNTSGTLTLSASATAGGLTSLSATPAANQIVPFQGDFDGDGLADFAYYNLATATWTIFDSSNSQISGPTTFTMGTPNQSFPLVGHFDPSGGTEMAVFTPNPQTGAGTFLIASNLTGTRSIPFGQAGDIPLSGDFFGFGSDQVGVYRPGAGMFLVYNPQTPALPGIYVVPSGTPDLASLVPAPGQYDNAAFYSAAPKGTNLPIFGRTEPAVYDPVTGNYTILWPGGVPNAVRTITGFPPNGIPAPADYFHTGSDQPAVYFPGTGQLFVQDPGTGKVVTFAVFGGSDNIPVTAPLTYRLPNPTALLGAGGSGTGGSGSGGGSLTTGTGGSGGSTTGGNTGGSGGVSLTTGTGGSGSGGSLTTGTGVGSTNSLGTTGSGGSTNGTPAGTPSQAGGSGSTTAPVAVGHKNHHRVVAKKPHPTRHVAKPRKVHHASAKAEHHHARRVVHVVPAAHHASARPEAATAGQTGGKQHVVDLAIESVHVNLRHKKGNEHHHGV